MTMRTARRRSPVAFPVFAITCGECGAHVTMVGRMATGKLRMWPCKHVAQMVRRQRPTVDPYATA